MTQETTRRHVLRVLRAWRERFLFGDDYLNGLTVRRGGGCSLHVFVCHVCGCGWVSACV
jgi:hypothetical protein